MKTLEDFRATYDALTDPGAARRYLGRVRAACTQRQWPLPAWAHAALNRPAPAAKRGVSLHLPKTQPIELPAELGAWRIAGVGRIVSRASNGSITLYDWPDGKPVYARFRDAAEACAALAAGAVEWTRKNRTVDSRSFVARGVA
jgi:hypothetical protein